MKLYIPYYEGHINSFPTYSFFIKHILSQFLELPSIHVLSHYVTSATLSTRLTRKRMLSDDRVIAHSAVVFSDTNQPATAALTPPAAVSPRQAQFYSE